jgi:MFS transporter, ACS family, glucarate transporter
MDMGPTTAATRVRYQVLAAGCLLAVLTYIQRLGFARGVPAIQESLDLNAEQIGDITAAFLLAYAGFQVPGGLLGDRFGARNLLTLLVLSWSLVTGLVTLTVLVPKVDSWPFVVLLVLRILFGMLQAGGFPVWARVIADWIPMPERGMAQGTIWTFSRLGGAFVPFLFLWLLNYFGTWTTPFWVMAGLGLLWCAAFWPWFRNRPEEMSQVNEAERRLIAAGRSDARTATGPVPWSSMLLSRNVWGLCLMYGFVGFTGNFITHLLPMYLKNHRKLTEYDTSWIFGLTLAFGVVSCLFGGWLSDWFIRRTGNRKWGRRLNGSIGLVVASLAVLSVPRVQETWLLAISLSVWFFCNDLIMGPAWASCADVGGPYTGALSGAMNMTGSLFAAAGMKLAGALLLREQAELMFVLFACSYVLASLSWLLVNVTKPLVAES